jgi:hypothetical protein
MQLLIGTVYKVERYFVMLIFFNTVNHEVTQSRDIDNMLSMSLDKEAQRVLISVM